VISKKKEKKRKEKKQITDNATTKQCAEDGQKERNDQQYLKGKKKKIEERPYELSQNKNIKKNKNGIKKLARSKEKRNLRNNGEKKEGKKASFLFSLSPTHIGNRSLQRRLWRRRLLRAKEPIHACLFFCVFFSRSFTMLFSFFYYFFCPLLISPAFLPRLSWLPIFS
jgi:hypothetical protein